MPGVSCSSKAIISPNLRVIVASNLLKIIMNSSNVSVDETPEVPSAANSVTNSVSDSVSLLRKVTWEENGPSYKTTSKFHASGRRKNASRKESFDENADDNKSAASQRSGGFAGVRTTMSGDEIKEAAISGVIFPWRKSYKTWWGFTVACSIFTIFFETFSIAFQPAGNPDPLDAASIIEYLFTSIFVADIVVYFHLAYYDENDALVFDKEAIAAEYLNKMFWVDLLGVFPFYHLLLGMTGQTGKNSELAKYLSLSRLAKLVRLHRVKQLFDNLQYSSNVSLMTLTLTRNFSFVLVWTHISACVMYFLAERYSFDPDNTWIGGVWEDLTLPGRYLTSLYWSITVRSSLLTLHVPYGAMSRHSQKFLTYHHVLLLLDFHYSWLR